MEADIHKLFQAFRDELEGCHKSLDDAGVPRAIGSVVLTLKSRIVALVEADRQTEIEMSGLRAEVKQLGSELIRLAGELERWRGKGD
jgi:hypothetical protein